MSLRDTVDGINEAGWERAMGRLPYKCASPFCQGRTRVPAEPCADCWKAQVSERLRLQREKQASA